LNNISLFTRKTTHHFALEISEFFTDMKISPTARQFQNPRLWQWF